MAENSNDELKGAEDPKEGQKPLSSITSAEPAKAIDGPEVPAPEAVGEGSGNQEKIQAQKVTTPPPEELQEKKVKRAFLERFKLHKKDKTSTNTLAEAVQPTTTEAVAKELYKQIADIKDEEYVVFRFRKKSLLLVLGFLVAAMWLYPLGRYGAQQVADGGLGSLWSPITDQAELTDTDSAYPYRVRIRNHNVTDEEAENMQALFTSRGFAFVEVVPDPDSEYEGVMVITKAKGETIRELITGILADTYSLASPSAELTDDSDFDAVILLALGPEASESAQMSE